MRHYKWRFVFLLLTKFSFSILISIHLMIQLIYCSKWHTILLHTSFRSHCTCWEYISLLAYIFYKAWTLFSSHCVSWVNEVADCLNWSVSQILSLQTAYDNLCVSSGTTALPHFLLKYTEESVEVAPLKDLKSFFPDLKKVIPCMDAPNVGQPKLFGEKTELIVTSANVWRHLKCLRKTQKHRQR